MFKRIQFALGATSSNRPVFVIGTGRSGTHWLGFALGDHPEVRATIEPKPLFLYSTHMALNPELEPKLMDKLIQGYRWELYKSAPKIYMEKTHPNIWHAERLKKEFPNARFVGIERNPYATVASMMVHPGVSKWHRIWREFPVPNRFLGITQEMAEGYDAIPLAAQCALRWKAHHERMEQLRGVLGDDLLVIAYEEFAEHTAEVLGALQRFMGLQQALPVPEVRRDSLHKWKKQLSPEQLEQIEGVVGFPPPQD